MHMEIIVMPLEHQEMQEKHILGEMEVIMC